MVRIATMAMMAANSTTAATYAAWMHRKSTCDPGCADAAGIVSSHGSYAAREMPRRLQGMDARGAPMAVGAGKGCRDGRNAHKGRHDWFDGLRGRRPCMCDSYGKLVVSLGSDGKLPEAPLA